MTRLPARHYMPSTPQKFSRTALFRAVLIATAISGVGTAALPAYAETAVIAEQRDWNIPAGPLDTALSRYAAEAGVSLSFEPQLVAGLRANAVSGRFTSAQALAQLLKGTGLIAEPVGGVVRLRRGEGEVTLRAIKVSAAAAGNVPETYAGGQVARGASLGVLGNRDLLDTPFNITSYTAELMQNQQAQSVADVVANDPSVRSVFSRGSYIDHFVIRGFRVANNNLGFGGLYGILPSQVAPIEGIERVEVLKGPNTFLGGAAPQGDANISGNINLVPKRAGAQPLTSLTLSAESDSLLGAHLDVGRRFGDDDGFGVRFNAVTRDGDTAIDRQTQRLGLAVLGLDARLEALRLSADIGYQRLHGGSQPYSVDVDSALPLPKTPKSDRNFNQRWEEVDVKGTVYGALRAEWDLSDSVTAFAAWGGRDEKIDYLYTNPYVFDASGNFEAAAYALPWQESARTGEIGLRGALSTGPVSHEWNVSATWFNVERRLRFVAFDAFTSNLYVPVAQPKPNLASVYSNPPKTYEGDLASYAVGDVMSFLDDRVQLTLGARLQKIEATNYNGVTGQRLPNSYDEDKVTPMAGLLFKLRQHVSLYANYMEGLSQGPVAPTGTVNVGEVFDPYVTEQIELGAKADWGSFTTTVSLFEISRPSAITRQLDTTPVTRVFEVDGEQRVRGIELQTFGAPLPRVRVLGGITYMDGELTKTQDGYNDGNDAVSVPDLQANVSVEWDPSALPGLTLWARTLYTSEQYLDEANRQKLPDWTRYDAGVRYRFVRDGDKQVVLRAGVENLLNEDYWVSASRGLTLSSPRALLFSATLDF